LAAIATKLRNGEVKKVAVLVGAGISCSAGIPDFRSPGTGLYSQLEAYNLPTPESVFNIEFFKGNPVPFNKLAKELFPGKFNPTPTHFFLKLLQNKGLLHVVMTQNIDNLERLAGVDADKLCEAHGSFASVSCITCKHAVPLRDYQQQVTSGGAENQHIPRCPRIIPIPPPERVEDDALEKMRSALAEAEKDRIAKLSEGEMKVIMEAMVRVKRLSDQLTLAEETNASFDEKYQTWASGKKEYACDGLVKPDIVFFGESLSPRFSEMSKSLEEADLGIVMGTSLSVTPFAGLIANFDPLCPRLLFNQEAVGLYHADDFEASPPGNAGFRINEADNYRDVFEGGACDDSVRKLCQLVGWENDLDALIAQYKTADVIHTLQRHDSTTADGGGDVAAAPKTSEKDKKAKGNKAATLPGVPAKE
jgi:NAD-dependent SIR2 family protein deacetylase